MENNILQDIIQVEKDIQLSIEKAKEMSRAWLEARKKAIDERLEKEEKENAASFQQSRQELARDAASKGDGLVKEAEIQADRIVHLKNDALARIVARHIRKILPGEP
jgi:vacuolar-type H+-ATPase subunit H